MSATGLGRALLLVASLVPVTAVLAPGAASAQVHVDPFAGWVRNGDLGVWRPGGGVSVDWLSERGISAGAEFGYASGFFDPPQGALDLIESSHVMTVSGQAGYAAPWRREGARVRPFVTAGLGVMRQHVRDRAGFIDVSRNDPAWNIGGGARVRLRRYFGVKGDVRYVRSLRAPYESPTELTAAFGRLAFWRVSAGGTLRFGG